MLGPQGEGFAMAETIADPLIKSPVPMTTEVIFAEQLGYDVKVSVSEQPLGFGGGVAHAEIQTNDQAWELARIVVDHLVLLPEDAATVCGDGRHEVEEVTEELTGYL